MSSLTAIFGSSEEKEQDSDKLMDLHWNRAELKKEFAGMRNEQFRLQDKIKQQEGATALLQQKLDHLQDLLIDAKFSHVVVVFYQLRGLGYQCESKLAKFAEQLKHQREQKRHHTVLSDWHEGLREESKQVELELLEIRDLNYQLEDQLQSEQRRLTTMNAFTRFFRGRSAMKLVDSIATQIETTGHEEIAIRNRLSEIKDRQPSDNQGLDIAAKRSINLMILSFAQQLYLHFDDTGIVGLVKEATQKSVGSINYGSRHECDQVLDKIDNDLDTVEHSVEFIDALQKRAKMLRERAEFSNSTDAVPFAGSVSTFIKIDPNGVVSQRDINIASENYWGISKVYSR